MAVTKEDEEPKSCKKNSDKNLCMFIRTVKTFHKMAKEMDYCKKG
ncbi:hypothetical protein [Methanohalobium sp.]|nr:hypothetical protein [Methanohalobium sp.]